MFSCLIFFTKCSSSIATDKSIEQAALNIANNIDSSSVNLLRKYCFGSRGNNKFWQRFSADTSLYACAYNIIHDTAELTIWQPYNFIKDFKSSFNFDTSAYNEFHFLKLKNDIVKLIELDNQGRQVIKDTLFKVQQIFPEQDPFITFSILTEVRNKYNFIGTFYRSDIGDFWAFWLSPEFKLTYLPDTLKMNKLYKKYWIDEFEKGKQIKEHWSLINVYDE